MAMNVMSRKSARIRVVGQSRCFQNSCRWAIWAKQGQFLFLAFRPFSPLFRHDLRQFPERFAKCPEVFQIIVWGPNDFTLAFGTAASFNSHTTCASAYGYKSPEFMRSAKARPFVYGFQSDTFLR